MFDNDDVIFNLWVRLNTVPLRESEEYELLIDAPFHIWGEGTPLIRIWDWFDESHSKGIDYLMDN